MKEYFYKLRQKPKHVRRRIASVLTVLLSGVVVAVWWGTFTPAPSHQNVSLNDALSPVGAFAGMLKTAADGAAGFTHDMKAQLTQLQYTAAPTGAAAVSKSAPPATVTPETIN